MGLETSRYTNIPAEWNLTRSFLSVRPLHTNILIVGGKGSGKTTLNKRIREILPSSAAMKIHTFDSSTNDDKSSMEKVRETYINGVDVTGLSMISTTQPVHGIVWVIDARTINIQSFDSIKEISKTLEGMSKIRHFMFFTHTDQVQRAHMDYIRALYETNVSILGSGECRSESILYAPLEGNKRDDANFTILMMIRQASDWTYNTNL